MKTEVELKNESEVLGSIAKWTKIKYYRSDYIHYRQYTTVTHKLITDIL